MVLNTQGRIINYRRQKDSVIRDVLSHDEKNDDEGVS